MKRAARIAFCLLAFAAPLLANDFDDSSWSVSVNGIQARITMREARVVNDARIIATYLTLRNSSDVGSPIKLNWTIHSLNVQVVDEAGRNVAQPKIINYDGGGVFETELVLPFDSSLTFLVSMTGLGIPKGKTAILDFGPMSCWIIDMTDGKKYFLKATLMIEDNGKPMNERYWHGTVDIPMVEIPPDK